MIERGPERSVVIRVTVGILLLVACAGTVHAFRCGQDLVRNNDSKEQVLKKCGQPAHLHGNRWYYDGRDGFLSREVTFVGGKVFQIRTVNPGT